MSPIFVVLEGMDFAGKSTIATLVGRELLKRGCKIRHQRACYLERTMGRIVTRVQNSRSLPNPIRSLVFQLSLSVDVIFWRFALDFGTDILLQESYADRVLVWHSTHQKKLWVQFLRTIYCGLPDPHLKFYLDCGAEERRRRSQWSHHRDARDSERFGSGWDRHQRMSLNLRRFAKLRNYEFFNTEEMTPEEVSHHIVTRILYVSGNTNYLEARRTSS